jgi:hypothetical protein
MEAPAAVARSEWAPISTPASPPEPTLIGANETPTDRGLGLLLFAIQAREFSLIDMSLLQESAVELGSLTLAELATIRFDTTIFDDLRTFVQNADISAVLSAPAGVAKAVGRLFIRRARTQPPAQDATYPTHVKKIRITPIGRVRFGRAVTQGLFGGVLATVLLTMPPEVGAKLATEATSTAGTVATEIASTAGTVAAELIAGIGSLATEVSATVGDKLAAAQPSGTLAKASFDVPPLSAYGASFAAQAPYPTTSPNGTVEWVVALRNTGSVGWYRGIDGAQASLALADGTTAGVQTTEYVGPGQVGWFVVHFTAPSQPGVAKVALLPRIDGRGSLPDLGIFARVTVASNP